MCSTGRPHRRIRQSRYVTVMMKRFTDTYSEDCVEISIVDAPFGMDAYCLYHASYTMNSREKQFIRELKELFADHPAESAHIDIQRLI